jgi:hypothetical protein
VSTRSIVDETGELVSVIVDVADYKRLIEAHTEVAEAVGVLPEAVRMMAGSGSSGTGYADYQRALRTLEKAQRTLSGAMRSLEILEDVKPIRAYDAYADKLERGENDLLS